MAGDWMKVEKVTPAKPEVDAIADILGIDPDAVFGKLFRLWSWFDDHTTDGNANGNGVCVTKVTLDRRVGVTGFADAMIRVGWLIEIGGGVAIPHFERHNSETTKQRALTAKRAAKSKAKKVEKSNAKGNGVVTVGALPREEKRRVLIAPAHDGDWTKARKTANELAEKLGPCSKPRDRRLLLGAAFVSQSHEGGDKWLAVALRETKEAHPQNPYAFFQKVAYSQANADGVDLSSSIGRLEIPPDLMERRKQPC